jgi:hypothetical protein
MSTSRWFTLFVALALAVAVVITINAGIVTSKVVSSAQAALDQQDHHVGFVNFGPALADQLRLEYRRGEWNAGVAAAALDQHERHPSAVNQGYARTAVLEQGSRYDRASTAVQPAATSRTTVLEQGSRFDRAKMNTTAFDAELARLEYRRGEWKAGTAAARAGAPLNQHNRHLGLLVPDNRTCVLCGGQ